MSDLNEPTEEIAGELGHRQLVDGHVTYQVMPFDVYRTRWARVLPLDCRGCGPHGTVFVRVAGQYEMRLVRGLFLVFVFLLAACIFLLLDIMTGFVPELSRYAGLACAAGALSAMIVRGLRMFIREAGISTNDSKHVFHVKSCRKMAGPLVDDQVNSRR